MNILAIDCAVSKLSLGVQAEDRFVSYTFDIGMRQSEILVPVIDEILQKAGITAKDLDYTALTIGPGSFTGLRLGISALKAIELAYKVPVYGLSSLKVYSYPVMSLGYPVLSCIDANKDKFYANIYDADKEILADGDYEVEEIAEKINGFPKIIVTGPDAKKMTELLKDKTSAQIITLNTSPSSTESLIELTKIMIEKGEKPLEDYDGPVYLRASEAELALKNKN